MISDERLVNIENYKMLAAAIIEKAVEDYSTALITKDDIQIGSLEKFFRSHEFMLYTDGIIDPEYIIQNVKRKVGYLARPRLRYRADKRGCP